MKKIDYIEFKKIINNLKNKNVLIKIETLIKTEIYIENVQITLNKYLLRIFNSENKKIDIDINYVANFYNDEKNLKLEFDAIGYILIKQK